MLKNKAWILCIIPFILAGCGGSTGSRDSGNASTAGQAQGVYSGSSSDGSVFDAIVLPNDTFYAIYGTVIGNVFYIGGTMSGQGTSSNGAYTASVTDFYYTGAVYQGSVTASYVPGSSLKGTLSVNGTSISFTGSSLPASSFNYSTSASLSAISGDWTGTLLNGATATVTINGGGSFSGSDSWGCLLSGMITPDSSNRNFFNLSLRFGGSPCLLPNQTASGVAVDYLLSDGMTRQLLASGAVGTSAGTVFAAQR